MEQRVDRIANIWWEESEKFPTRIVASIAEAI